MQAQTAHLLLLRGIGVYFTECRTHAKHETSGKQVTVTGYAP